MQIKYDNVSRRFMSDSFCVLSFIEAQLINNLSLIYGAFFNIKNYLINTYTYVYK